LQHLPLQFSRVAIRHLEMLVIAVTGRGC